MIKLSKGIRLFTRNNIIRVIFIALVVIGGIVLFRVNNREGFDQDQEKILIGNLLSKPLNCGSGHTYPRYSGTCDETYTHESGNHDKLQYCVNEVDIHPSTPVANLQQSIDTQTCNLLTHNYTTNQIGAMNQNPDGTSCNT